MLEKINVHSSAVKVDISIQGTERCDHFTGQCICKPGVEVHISRKASIKVEYINQDFQGRNCDRCQADHWGFASGTGCYPCECSDASEHGQCDQVIK